MSPMPEDKEFNHPSFGTVSIGRAQVGGGGTTLFDSPFRHNHVITLAIGRASLKRSFHQDRVMGDVHDLVRVEMSEVQFAKMITSPNMGSGTPCTLTHVNGKAMPRPPQQNVRKSHADDLKGEFKKVRGWAKELEELAKQKTFKAADRKKLQDLSGCIERALAENLAWYFSQFEEKMSEVVMEARAEVEAHIANVAKKTGLEHLKGNTLALLGGPDSKPGKGK